MIIRGRNVFKKLTEHLPTYHLSFDRYYSLATANYVRRGGGDQWEGEWVVAAIHGHLRSGYRDSFTGQINNLCFTAFGSELGIENKSLTDKKIWVECN